RRGPWVGDFQRELRHVRDGVLGFGWDDLVGRHARRVRAGRRQGDGRLILVDGGDVAVDDLHGAVAATGGGFQLRAARPPGGDLIDGAVAAEPEHRVQPLVRLRRFRRRACGRGRRRGGRVAGGGDLGGRVGG